MYVFCFVYLAVSRGFGKCQVLSSKLYVLILFDFTCEFVGYSGNLKFAFYVMFLFCIFVSVQGIREMSSVAFKCIAYSSIRDDLSYMSIKVVPLRGK